MGGADDVVGGKDEVVGESQLVSRAAVSLSHIYITALWVGVGLLSESKKNLKVRKINNGSK